MVHFRFWIVCPSSTYVLLNTMICLVKSAWWYLLDDICLMKSAWWNLLWYPIFITGQCKHRQFPPAYSHRCYSPHINISYTAFFMLHLMVLMVAIFLSSYFYMQPCDEPFACNCNVGWRCCRRPFGYSNKKTTSKNNQPTTQRYHRNASFQIVQWLTTSCWRVWYI